MNIPEPYASILVKNMKNVKDEKDIKKFIDRCFRDLFSRMKRMSFQSRASKSGDMFEYVFYYIMKCRYGIDLDSSIPIKEACMLDGGELDFGIVRNGKILCGIEAKGSAERAGGEELSRPALKRTDTVKKAISQAYQFKRIFPNKPFFIVTNVVPTSGNARCMIDLAEGDIVDKVVDITNPKDLMTFVKTLRKIMQEL